MPQFILGDLAPRNPWARARVPLARFAFIASCLLLAIATPAFAHHSFAAYDRTVSRSITGVVKEYEWANPHVRLVLVVTQPDGATRDWSFESGSTSHMASVGFSRVSAVEGEVISVTYHPRRSGPGGGYFIALEKANGRSYGPILAR